MKRYWSVALLGWQDSLAYRFNALVWGLYAVLPSLTLMLVWLAVYEGPKKKTIAGCDLPNDQAHPPPESEATGGTTKAQAVGCSALLACS